MDILSEVPLFWGQFESNILNFSLRIEEKELKMENSGQIRGIWGRRMENGGLKIQDWGMRDVVWGWNIKIWGFNHAQTTFNTHISGNPVSQSTLFWGHCKTLSFPLEDILKLFPGLSNDSLAAKGHSLTTCNAALPATSHCLQRRTTHNAAPPVKSKMATRGLQNCRGV